MTVAGVLTELSLEMGALEVNPLILGEHEVCNDTGTVDPKGNLGNMFYGYLEHGW